ncbi:MAG: threonylcarbamoyl-AMP synthase [Deltaproteobacteria bacterium]|nr:threonylcarbamoyl-AMP synthase [Deltaproteobacteria bacterium]
MSTPINSAVIDQACGVLERGGIVAVPTETVYGLAGRIDRPEAIRAIFELKGRPLFDPLIVHIGEPVQLGALTRDVPEVLALISERFWPGPLTIVLPKSEAVSDLITAGFPTVGVRMPLHPTAREIARRMIFAAPSANRFTRVSPTTAEHVRSEFPDAGLLIIDGGESEHGLESTVIDYVGDVVRILRPGMITAEQIESVLSERFPSTKVISASSAAAPGQLKEHYRPAIPLVIVSESTSISAALMKDLGIQGEQSIELELGADPILLARRLYSDLRTLSDLGADFIVVRKRADMQGGYWNAIWNRLERAATAIIP